MVPHGRVLLPEGVEVACGVGGPGVDVDGGGIVAGGWVGVAVSATSGTDVAVGGATVGGGSVGVLEGVLVGALVGVSDAVPVGVTLGVWDGTAVGSFVGSAVAVGGAGFGVCVATGGVGVSGCLGSKSACPTWIVVVCKQFTDITLVTVVPERLDKL
jgi:hypothetical protein